MTSIQHAVSPQAGAAILARVTTATWIASFVFAARTVTVENGVVR
jgi:hypothetical protein